MSDQPMFDQVIKEWCKEAFGSEPHPIELTTLQALLSYYGLRVVPTPEMSAQMANQIRALMLDDEEILRELGYVKREDPDAE